MKAAVATALAGLALAACGEEAKRPQTEPAMRGVVAPGAAPAFAEAGAARRQPAALRVRRSRFGRIVTDGGRYTLYVFTRDRPGRSRCYGECAEAWPPLLAKRKPAAGKGIRRGKIGLTRRRGGKRQVTYAGRPLYYYVGDSEPGVILCQAVPEFGGTWYVVSPRGRAIR